MSRKVDVIPISVTTPTANTSEGISSVFLTFVMVSIVTGLPFSLLYHVDMFYLAMLSALIALGVVSVGMFAWMAGESK